MSTNRAGGRAGLANNPSPDSRLWPLAAAPSQTLHLIPDRPEALFPLRPCTVVYWHQRPRQRATTVFSRFLRCEPLLVSLIPCARRHSLAPRSRMPQRRCSSVVLRRSAASIRRGWPNDLKSSPHPQMRPAGRGGHGQRPLDAAQPWRPRQLQRQLDVRRRRQPRRRCALEPVKNITRLLISLRTHGRAWNTASMLCWCPAQLVAHAVYARLTAWVPEATMPSSLTMAAHS